MVLSQIEDVGKSHRGFVEMAAAGLGLTGYVRHLNDGRVQVEVEGERSAVEVFLQRLRRDPSVARATALKVSWHAPTGGVRNFSIRCERGRWTKST